MPGSQPVEVNPQCIASACLFRLQGQIVIRQRLLPEDEEWKGIRRPLAKVGWTNSSFSILHSPLTRNGRPEILGAVVATFGFGPTGDS